MKSTLFSMSVFLFSLSFFAVEGRNEEPKKPRIIQPIIMQEQKSFDEPVELYWDWELVET